MGDRLRRDTDGSEKEQDKHPARIPPLHRALSTEIKVSRCCVAAMINVNAPHYSLLSSGCFEGRRMKPAVRTHLTMFGMFCIWKGPIYGSGADFLMQYDAIFREK